MNEWKNETCKNCNFRTEPPRPAGETKPPTVFICRVNPPNIIYAMAQGRIAGGPPQPVPLGSLYPLVDDNHLACSRFEAELKPFEFPKKAGIVEGNKTP